jgi:hypothetical protein
MSEFKIGAAPGGKFEVRYARFLLDLLSSLATNRDGTNVQVMSWSGMMEKNDKGTVEEGRFITLKVDGKDHCFDLAEGEQLMQATQTLPPELASMQLALKSAIEAAHNGILHSGPPRAYANGTTTVN